MRIADKSVRSYGGKRIARMRIPTQVNQDPEMSREIKDRAARQMRPVGSEIIHLLKIGLYNDPEQIVFEYFLRVAKSRKATRAKSRPTRNEPLPANLQAMLDRMELELGEREERRDAHGDH